VYSTGVRSSYTMYAQINTCLGAFAKGMGAPTVTSSQEHCKTRQLALFYNIQWHIGISLVLRTVTNFPFMCLSAFPKLDFSPNFLGLHSGQGGYNNFD
jgi:hypothetical protein